MKIIYTVYVITRNALLEAITGSLYTMGISISQTDVPTNIYLRGGKETKFQQKFISSTKSVKIEATRKHKEDKYVKIPYNQT